MSRPSFNLRLRRYDPLGAASVIVPDEGLTLTSGPEGGTLTATLSTVVSGSLPDDCEVAVEVWADSIGAWTEGRDSRFVLLTQDADDRDRTGTVQVQGVALMAWLGQRAALAGVKPYLETGATVEAAKSSTTVSVSGSTFTWGSHGMGVGDRVNITAKGAAKGLTTGTYYVRSATSSTFQLSHTPTGAIKTGMGSHGSLHMERIRTRINVPGHHFKKNEAVTVQNGDGSNLSDGSLYYVVGVTTNTIQVASKPGGLPLTLAANTLNVYRYLDGQRVWKNATPGTILSDAFLEARDRGWGVDAAGHDQVFHSWTEAADSDGYGWKARVDDPTVTGVSIGFEPGTPLTSMLQFLVDNDWAEWSSLGRTLDLRNVNSGHDWSDPAGGLRRIGTEASEVKVTKDLSEYRTAAIVRGEGPVEEVVSVARSPWGRLEQYQQAAGVGSPSHARSYGNADLAKNSKPAVGYIVTEAAQEAAWLPILDYQRGDWVQVQVKGAWTRLRVVQWTFTKNTDGSATVTVTLDKVKRAALHKLAKAHGKATAGRTSLTHTATVETGKRKAAKPLAVRATSTAVYAKDKSSKASLTVKWSAVTTDTDGDAIGAKHYEVWVRSEGEEHGHAVASTAGTTVNLHNLPSSHTLAVSVRAQSTEGEWGELSDEVEHITGDPGADDAGVPLRNPPTAPQVTSTLGSMRVTWDGLIAAEDGNLPPDADDALGFVQVERGTAADGPWTPVGQHLQASGTVTDLGLTVGATYWYRLRAFDTMGRASAPSPAASAAVVGIDVAQINAGFKQSMDSVAAIASDAQTVANQSAATAGTALSTANSVSGTASNALAAANGKSKITYSQSAVSGQGVNPGDLWFRVDTSNRIIGQWTWDGTAWQGNVITGAVLTNLDAGSITTGTLSAARISARSISTDQLAVADLTNLFPAPWFDFGGPYFWSGWQYGGSDVPRGNAWQMVTRDNTAKSGFPVKAGESFYIEATVKKVSGTVDLQATLWLTRADGSGSSQFAPWDMLSQGGNQAAGLLNDLGNGWLRYFWRFSIPTTWTDAAIGVPYFWINQDGNNPTTAWAVADLSIRRAANARLIVDGSITAGAIAANAIDGKTITGASIRTASNVGSGQGGVILDGSGITGYNSGGSATFRVDNQGNTSMTGTVNATGGTISGTLTLTSGAIRSNSNGTTYSVMDSQGFMTQGPGGNVRMNTDGAGNAAIYWSTGHSIYSSGSGVTADLHVSSGDWLYLESYTGVQMGGGGVMADLNVGSDTTGPRLWSTAIRNRRYSAANVGLNVAGPTDTGVVCITSAGTLGVLNDGFYMPGTYANAQTGRAMNVASNGSLGYTSSARRTKDLDRHIAMDDTSLAAWLALPTWRFTYKADPAKRALLGVVAEEVAEAGFTDLVYYDESDSETKGQVDGFAYERMGVYNHLAVKRLYARLMAAELRLAALDGKAA